MKNFLTYFVLLLTLCVNASAQDGALDTSFTLDTTAIQGATAIVKIVVQPTNGKILCLYRKISQGLAKTYLTRFESNGSADDSFTTQRVGNQPYDIQLQSDGKIIIADSNGYLTRLKSDGEKDTLFNTRTSNNRSEKVSIESMKVGKDDKITTAHQGNIYVLSADGMIEKQVRFMGWVNTIAEQTDGKLLFSGFNVLSYNSNTMLSVILPKLIRTSFDLILDTTFKGNIRGTGRQVWLEQVRYEIKTCINDKILFYGRDGSPNGELLKCFDKNGQEDSTFNRWNGTVKGVEDGSLLEILPLADGKSILVGSFRWYNGVSTPGIVRVDSTGTIDYSFDMGTGTDGAINSIAVLPNNQLLIAGDFSTYNGIPKRLMAKLTLNQNSIVNAWRASFTIKPNPAADECTLDNIPSGFSVKIVDNSGKVAAYYPPAPQTKELVINTRGFASGVYYVFIEDTAGHVFNNILTVEH